MIVRMIDGTGDWFFGKGKNDYLSGIRAVEQNIATRLRSFLGDCFFDLGAGLDWFNLLGAKDLTALNLSINAIILNTENVTGLSQTEINLNNHRNLTITYAVQTTFSVLSSSFQFDVNGIG